MGSIITHPDEAFPLNQWTFSSNHYIYPVWPGSLSFESWNEFAARCISRTIQTDDGGFQIFRDRDLFSELSKYLTPIDLFQLTCTCAWLCVHVWENAVDRISVTAQENQIIQFFERKPEHIRQVNFSHCRFYQDPSKLTYLESFLVYLNGFVLFNEDSLSLLSSLNNLTTIQFTSCSFSKTGGFWPHFDQLKSLHTLIVTPNPRLAVMWEGVMQLPFFSISPFTGDSCSELSLLTNLTCLQLPCVDGEELRYIGRLTSLLDLKLQFCYQLGDDSFRSLSTLKHLTHLECQTPAVSREGYTFLRNLDDLVQLGISCPRQLTDKGLNEIASLKNLEVLEIAYSLDDVGHSQVTNEGLLLLTQLRCLKEVDICECPNCHLISEESIKLFQEHGIRLLRTKASA